MSIDVYEDNTTQVSITVSFVLKHSGSPVLTQLLTGPKKDRFSVHIPTKRTPKNKAQP